jgi:hypothetical protein
MYAFEKSSIQSAKQPPDVENILNSFSCSSLNCEIQKRGVFSYWEDVGLSRKTPLNEVSNYEILAFLVCYAA